MSSPIAPVLRAVHVRRSPEQAFRLFTDRFGSWWPLASHGLYGERAAGVAFEDGRIVERSLDGEHTVWGEVLAWEPPTRVAFTWHPGRDDGPRTEVEVRFLADDNGTRVELTHAGWERYGDQAEDVRSSYSGPNAWGKVLDDYCHVADDLAVDADADADATGAPMVASAAGANAVAPAPAPALAAEASS